MTGTLKLRGLSLAVFLGALPSEKLFPRRVVLDVSFTGNDHPVRFVDYSEICSLIASISEESFDYIEQLAERVHSLLSDRWPGKWRVSARKPFPPVDQALECAEYTIAD